MKTKKLIIHLIKEDMRFNQYIAALRRLGIEIHTFDLDLMSIIARLMKVEGIPDAWMDLYVTQLSKSTDVPYEPMGKNLYPLAKECYYSLLNFKTNDDDVSASTTSHC